MTTHRERIQACIAGERPDRTPVALWRHFPVDDQDPEQLAAAQVAFQRTFDFDLVKVTPASSFCLKDWGADDAWEGHTEGTRRYTKGVLSGPAEWEKLPVLDPDKGHLGAQLACLRSMRAALGTDTPMLQTVFSPLAQAKHLATNDTLLVHMRKYPDALLKGLETIARTTRRFVEAAAETGIDGIFYAVQHAQAELLSPDEFGKFGRVPDLSVLEAAQDLWCNMLHIHGDYVYFDAVADYPVQIINWHDRDTGPSLTEALASRAFQGGTASVLCGGIRRETLALGTAEAVRREAEDAIRQTGGKQLVLSTGCVVPVIAPYGNFIAARDASVPA